MPPAKKNDAPPPGADDPATSKGKEPEVVNDSEGEEDDEDEDQAGAEGAAAEGGSGGKKKKKRKSKKKKGAAAAAEEESDKVGPEAAQKLVSSLTDAQLKQLWTMNPALSNEITAGGTREPTRENVMEMLQKMSIHDLLTGMPSGRGSVKDMGAFKFWKTQPVPKFGEKIKEEGPMQVKTVDDVSQEPDPLPEGFEWVTMDLTSEEELKEVHDLLEGHYVEDDTAMLRFNYSIPILRWAMLAPGWKPDYHIGVRASQSRRLVAFISAIPVRCRVRKAVITVSEVNFLVVHKKLRNKRLAPVMIKEVTRRSNLNDIWQGLYTGGNILPTPVSTCRYYHRALDWQKLYEIGFSPLPPGSRPSQQIKRYQLPEKGKLKGVPVRHGPEFTKEEFIHWFVSATEDREERVVWGYVVEDDNGKITDFFSFYGLDSSVINHNKHKLLRAAYHFYYATETGLTEKPDKSALKKRLNDLMHEALVFGKKLKFDVYNALTLMENSLVLNDHHFGGGDGNLHYYLFNYKTAPISGGVTKANRPDEDKLSGIGVVML
ncbi:unnamed protein product [Parascedosporium putredinis]|uniref:Glycylpeptide N-tetradecanoyltransferase n=1 Tax=Parascedosporium putredinis TaxID=1442378 RepID=A0A9P1MFY5_9PEZI|nr:unnamed protein product [Parascedosporium putredinis]CAI8003339.1 unnamed protein product [Parascedosporium putredinis]